MQHDSKRWFTLSSTPAAKPQPLPAPIVLDDALLSLIGGGATDMTEPPEPINLVASDSTDGPNTNW